MDFTSPSARWTALTTRNRDADSHFVYAVKTTKIFCRPSCAARLARRANVEFYETPSAAAKAGFRACKRCKPDSEPQDDPQEVAVAKACEIIRAALSSTEHANGHVGLNELAERVELTPSYLHKTFKAKMGMTPKAYAEGLRQHMEGRAAMTEPVTGVTELAAHDAYSTFADDVSALDFEFGAVNVLDVMSDTADPTFGCFSESSPSVNTPITTDWSWLGTSDPILDCCDFSDGQALAEAILKQVPTGWSEEAFPSYAKYSP